VRLISIPPPHKASSRARLPSLLPKLQRRLIGEGNAKGEQRFGAVCSNAIALSISGPELGRGLPAATSAIKHLLAVSDDLSQNRMASEFPKCCLLLGTLRCVQNNSAAHGVLLPILPQLFGKGFLSALVALLAVKSICTR
jgi:VIT1/CCC1 family predicted Fe2+/Mn2+ transporter